MNTGDIRWNDEALSQLAYATGFEAVDELSRDVLEQARRDTRPAPPPELHAGSLSKPSGALRAGLYRRPWQGAAGHTVHVVSPGPVMPILEGLARKGVSRGRRYLSAALEKAVALWNSGGQ